jgi:hypothetical protein
MPLVHIVLAFTFQAASLSMSIVPTFMVASFPRLAKLLCLCRCLPFLCYPLILSLLLFEVGFGLNLTSFWGCLWFISCAFDYSIGSFKPSRMVSSRFFTYFLTELFEIQWTNQHGSFFSCCHVGVCAILEEVVQISKRFMPALKGLCRTTNLLFKKSIIVLQMFFFSSLIG